MPKSSKEIQFLEGRQSRRKEFYFTLKVAWEFIKGFRTLHFVGPCITIFGSARLGEKTPEYQQTVEIAGKISQLGFTIMTGGGPGIMEAANRGAREVGGRSVGVNIELPFEQNPNPYLDRSYPTDISHRQMNPQHFAFCVCFDLLCQVDGGF